MTARPSRLDRLKQKTAARIKSELTTQVEAVRNRPDYTATLEPFIQTLILAPAPGRVHGGSRQKSGYDPLRPGAL